MAAYVNIPVNLVGGESESRSRFWSSQSSVNLYVDSQGTGRTPTALMPWPGEKSFSSGVVGTTRGFYSTSGGSLYLLLGSSLDSISALGAQTYIGSVPSSGRASFADDGVNLMIAIDGSTVAYINNQFVVSGGGGAYLYDGSSVSPVSLPSLASSQWCASNPGDPTTFSASNIGTAEAVGDSLLQVFVFQQKLYLAGSGSIEVLYNSGTGSPPFARIEQSVSTSLGVGSPYSMAASTDYLYFLGEDGAVYRTSAYQPQSVTPSSIAREIGAVDFSDAFAFVCKIHGVSFYVLQLPSAGITLAYSEKTGEWSRLSSGLSLGRHLVSGYGHAFGKHLVADNDSGDIYEWDFDTYQSNGSTILRQRDSAPINGVSLGAPGERLVMNKVTILMETGVGNTNIPDPEIMVSASYDGGRSFTNEDWIKIGRDGESLKRIDWYNVATFYDMVLRVKVSDPAFIALHGASIELKKAGI